MDDVHAVLEEEEKRKTVDDVHAVLEEEEACEKRAYSCFGTATVTALAEARKRAEGRDRKGLQSKAVIFSKNVLIYSEVRHLNMLKSLSNMRSDI